MPSKTDSIPIEATASWPFPGMAVPGDFQFSPDGGAITYLFSPERSMVRQLYSFDPQSGESKLLIAPPQGGIREDNISPFLELKGPLNRRQLHLASNVFGTLSPFELKYLNTELPYNVFRDAQLSIFDIRLNNDAPFTVVPILVRLDATLHFRGL